MQAAPVLTSSCALAQVSVTADGCTDALDRSTPGSTRAASSSHEPPHGDGGAEATQPAPLLSAFIRANVSTLEHFAPLGRVSLVVLPESAAEACREGKTGAADGSADGSCGAFEFEPRLDVCELQISHVPDAIVGFVTAFGAISTPPPPHTHTHTPLPPSCPAPDTRARARTHTGTFLVSAHAADRTPRAVYQVPISSTSSAKSSAASGQLCLTNSNRRWQRRRRRRRRSVGGLIARNGLCRRSARMARCFRR